MSIVRLALLSLCVCAALCAVGVAVADEVGANEAGRAGVLPGFPVRNTASKRLAEEAIQRTFAERFGLHEPIYFIYGNEPEGAKYQFSFKYRLMGDRAPAPSEAAGAELEALRRFFFGYTQRSLWDIDSFSSPFYDTSYMPELFYEWQRTLDAERTDGIVGGDFAFLGYQVGLKHESNGKAGSQSRSLNTINFRPAFMLGDFARWHVVLAPRLHIYVSDLSDNPDIRDYRGNVELQAVLGYADGVALAVTGRVGRKGTHGSVQLDLTVPIEFHGRFNFASYFLIQYWSGYGENLLDYNKHSDALRFGFSLLR